MHSDRSRRLPVWVLGLLVVYAISALCSLAGADELSDEAARNAEALKHINDDPDAREAEIHPMWWIAPAASVLALLFAIFFYRKMSASDPGTPVMRGIARSVAEGAIAYLRQQYKALAIFFVLVAALLSVMAYVDHSQSEFVPFAFLTGGFFSALCGYLGMRTATRASNRTAAGARDKDNGLNRGLQVAFRSGAVMGLVVVGFGLFDICVWFLILKGLGGDMLGRTFSLEEVTIVMLCFGMGASAQALFARVGGGIYTKAADVGADLVGKVEAGIPEDDPRNPATIADNVGDNVGDVAGMGADLYESYCGSILASAALGVAAIAALFTFSSDTFGPQYWGGIEKNEYDIDGMVAAQFADGEEVTDARKDEKLAKIVEDADDNLPLIGKWAEEAKAADNPRDKAKHYANAYKTPEFKMEWQGRFLVLPMVVAGMGILISIMGIFMVRTKEGATFKELLKALGTPIWITSILLAILSFVIVFILFEGHFIGVAMSIVIGLFAGVWIGNRTEFYTSYDFKPTQGVSKQSEYGPATVIIDGIATGMYSTIWPVVTVVFAIILAFGFAGGFEHPELGLYGVGLAAVGMLATLGYTLATDAYGPIADNAGGNAEMAGLEPTVRERTDALDSLGNTTAATGKGFAIGSAALTALALLAAYLDQVRTGLMRAANAAVNGKLSTDASVQQFTLNEEIATNAEQLTAARESVQDLDMTFLADGRLAMVTDGGGVIPVRTASFEQFTDFYHVNLMNPIVLIGILVGTMLAFAFCAMTMKAVGRAAASMVGEVRRQFRSIAGIMEFKPGDMSAENQARRPDYDSCVAIATRGAQREMMLPSIIAVAVPVVIGLVFGVAGVVGLLAGSLAGGFLLAIMMSNAGGAWDNAKKWIEHRKKITIADVFGDDPEMQAYIKKTEELLEADFKERYRLGNPERELDAETVAAIGLSGTVKLKDVWANPTALVKLLELQPEEFENRPTKIVDGKASGAHDAGVIGDTVGDPFKDTSGPSLNILIKLMATVSIVFAGVTAKWGAQILDAWSTWISQVF